jgi:hypothetical protein
MQHLLHFCRCVTAEVKVSNVVSDKVAAAAIKATIVANIVFIIINRHLVI